MRAAVGLLLLASVAIADEWPEFDSWWDYRDPGATEARFRELLARNPPDPDYRIQLTTQLARTLGLQGQFDAASAMLAAVEAELEAASAETRVRWLLERGRVLNSAGDPGAARPLFEAAWQLGRENDLEGYAVDAGHMIAIVAEGPDGIEWNERLIAYAERSDDPDAQRWLGSLYNNLGWGYFDRQDYTSALATHRKGQAFWETRDEPVRLRIARWSVAKQLRFLGRCDEALAINRELEAEWAAAGEPDGYVFEELGECLLVLDDADAARREFARAYELLSADDWLAANEPDRLARLKQLSTDPTDPTDPG